MLGNNHRPSWSQLAHRFSSESDCLAAFIALETAEILAGAKPSALISIPNRSRICGRNLYKLWLKHGFEVLEQTCLFVREIGNGSGNTQLLFYIANDIAHFLRRRDVSTLLARAWYQSPILTERALDQLEERLKAGTFPHEIGLFLGYHPKDVAAFMGWFRLPFACQGPWKMFGNPRASLRLAEIFRNCRNNMAERLASAQSALECIAPVTPSGKSLFLPTN
ncbi:MAG: DUF3793 family protein [Desulfuromonadales bacterium]|nr:DUF3793 family protein [Desulfuromonadales bacterium]